MRTWTMWSNQLIFTWTSVNMPRNDFFRVVKIIHFLHGIPERVIFTQNSAFYLGCIRIPLACILFNTNTPTKSCLKLIESFEIINHNDVKIVKVLNLIILFKCSRGKSLTTIQTPVSVTSTGLECFDLDTPIEKAKLGRHQAFVGAVVVWKPAGIKVKSKKKAILCIREDLLMRPNADCKLFINAPPSRSPQQPCFPNS